MVRFRRRARPRAMTSLTVAAMALPVVARAQAADRFDSPIVSTQWLAEHLNDPNVVVLQLASTRRDYTSGHIPGARFLWFNDVAPSNPDLNTELPSVARLDSLFESLGVSDNSRIVIYGQTITPIVARVFMTLDYLGAGDRAAVLDGGLAAWKADSAQNIPFTTLTDSTGKMKDRAAISGLFAAAGVQPTDRVVTYCHVGQQASLLFLAAKYVGIKPSLYDGSFEDWSSRDDTPIVGPAKK